MKKSESIAKLAVALMKFNQSVGRIIKDGKNPHFKSNYATYDQIIDATRPILADNGISVLQFLGGDEEGRVIVTTMLLHESGEYIESDPLVMKPVKNDPQGMGSACTYAKRYGLAAILSLSTGQDDDGNAASFVGQSARQPQHEVDDNRPVDGLDGHAVEIKVEQPSLKAIALWNILGTDPKKKAYKDPNKIYEYVEKQMNRGYSMKNIEANLANEIRVPDSIGDLWVGMYIDNAETMKKLHPWYVSKRIEGMTDAQIETQLAEAMSKKQTAAAGA